MSTVIRTNHHWREIEYQIPEWEEEGEYHASFTYKGDVYFLSEFPRITHIDGWDAALGLSYFSAILIKLSDCGDAVKVAYSYW